MFCLSESDTQGNSKPLTAHLNRQKVKEDRHHRGEENGQTSEIVFQGKISSRVPNQEVETAAAT